MNNLPMITLVFLNWYCMIPSASNDIYLSAFVTCVRLMRCVMCLYRCPEDYLPKGRTVCPVVWHNALHCAGLKPCCAVHGLWGSQAQVPEGPKPYGQFHFFCHILSAHWLSYNHCSGFTFWQDAKGFIFFLMGALAKMVATFVTYPLQVIQARLRVRPVLAFQIFLIDDYHHIYHMAILYDCLMMQAGQDKKGYGFEGMLYALDQIYKWVKWIMHASAWLWIYSKEWALTNLILIFFFFPSFLRKSGVKGLYKGLESKLTQTVLMAALMFFTYEKIASLVFRIMRAEAMRAAAVS